MKTTCEKPLPAYQLVNQTSKTGKKKIIFGFPEPGQKAIPLNIDCGQCVGCRVKRRMDLALRLAHEAQMEKLPSWFVTLTYDDEYLPYAESLVADHISGFIKKVRKKGMKCRFFGVGEYGQTCPDHGLKKCPYCGELQRPHYHVILFGVELNDLVLMYEKHQKNMNPAAHVLSLIVGNQSIKYYDSETLSKAWGKGHVNVTGVSAATMQYVAKYHVEKVTGQLADEHYQRVLLDDRIVEVEKPQARMSRMPGIGRRWIEKYWPEVYNEHHPQGTVVACGAEFAPPAYYDRWLENNHPDIYERAQLARIENSCLESHLSSRREAIAKNRKSQMETPGRLPKLGRYKNDPAPPKKC